MKKLLKFLKEEDGVTAPEYALIAALIAGVIIAGVTYLGTQIDATMDFIGDQMPAGAAP